MAMFHCFCEGVSKMRAIMPGKLGSPEATTDNACQNQKGNGQANCFEVENLKHQTKRNPQFTNQYLDHTI